MNIVKIEKSIYRKMQKYKRQTACDRSENSEPKKILVIESSLRGLEHSVSTYRRNFEFQRDREPFHKNVLRMNRPASEMRSVRSSRLRRRRPKALAGARSKLGLRASEETPKTPSPTCKNLNLLLKV